MHGARGAVKLTWQVHGGETGEIDAVILLVSAPVQGGVRRIVFEGLTQVPPAVAVLVDPRGSVVERRVEDAKDGRETWKKMANLAAGTVEYSDATVRSGQRVAYRVRAVNAEGESAYSNIVRMTFSTK